MEELRDSREVTSVSGRVTFSREESSGMEICGMSKLTLRVCPGQSQPQTREESRQRTLECRR